MKFLILFAVGVLFGSVHCDEECFRAVFKECVKEPPSTKPMTLCDDIKFQTSCVSRLAAKCNMGFKYEAETLDVAIQRVCSGGIFEKWFDENKACFKKQVNDSECVGEIDDAMRDLKTSEDFIKANKKICKLFDPYSKCVVKRVEKNCNFGSKIVFNALFRPLSELSDSLCEQLIIPADETDSRPDNFGMLNMYASVVAVFASA